MAGLNYNVTLAIIFTLLSGISGGMCYFGVLPAFLYLITHNSNTKVGAAEGLQGFTATLFSFLIGYLSDLPNMKRQTMLRAGGAIGLLGTAFIYYALLHEDYVWMCISLFVFGILNAFQWGPLETILADSLETGSRSFLYTVQNSLSILSGAIGPLLAVILFKYGDNAWTIEECRFVLYIGLAPMGLSCVVMFFFLDSHTLGKESEALDAALGTEPRGEGGTSAVTLSEEGISPGPEPTSSSSGPSNVDRENGPLLDWLARDNEGPSGCCRFDPRIWIRPVHVPYLIIASDFIFAIASGMTVKFFPLFFQNEVQLSPVGVNSIYILTPLALSTTGFICQRFSKLAGRVPAFLLFRYVGISLLFTMQALRAQWTAASLIIPIYIARTAIINGPESLEQSVLMDFVPKKQRGMFNALSCVAAFGWSGSAFFGGWVVDQYGYGVTFFVTALLQSIASSMWILLWHLVPDEKPTGAENNERRHITPTSSRRAEANSLSYSTTSTHPMVNLVAPANAHFLAKLPADCRTYRQMGDLTLRIWGR